MYLIIKNLNPRASQINLHNMENRVLNHGESIKLKIIDRLKDFYIHYRKYGFQVIFEEDENLEILLENNININKVENLEILLENNIKDDNINNINIDKVETINSLNLIDILNTFNSQQLRYILDTLDVSTRATKESSLINIILQQDEKKVLDIVKDISR